MTNVLWFWSIIWSIIAEQMFDAHSCRKHSSLWDCVLKLQWNLERHLSQRSLLSADILTQTISMTNIIMFDWPHRWGVIWHSSWQWDGDFFLVCYFNYLCITQSGNCLGQLLQICCFQQIKLLGRVTEIVNLMAWGFLFLCALAPQGGTCYCLSCTKMPLE